MAKPPTDRGFTIAEARSLQFERVSLFMVLLVAVVAAVISFQALTWLGETMGLGWAAPLVPLAIDGFAVACSIGIIRSQASGHGTRDRVSEWLGLFIALGLSIAGNVTHALHTGSRELPVGLVSAFAAAVPIIVAYGIHVYGRAMARGISANVLAEDPGRIHFDLQHLGDTTRATTTRTPRAARAPRTARTETAPTFPVSIPMWESSTTPIPTKAAPAAREAHNDARTRVVALCELLAAQNPTSKPDAAAIHTELALPHNPATTRRWVQQWWEDKATTDTPQGGEPADTSAA